MKYSKFRHMETMNADQLRAAIDTLTTGEKLELIQGALDHDEIPYVNLNNAVVIYALVTQELNDKVNSLESKLTQVREIIESVPSGNESIEHHKDFQIEAIGNLFINAPYDSHHDGTN